MVFFVFFFVVVVVVFFHSPDVGSSNDSLGLGDVYRNPLHDGEPEPQPRDQTDNFTCRSCSKLFDKREEYIDHGMAFQVWEL